MASNGMKNKKGHQFGALFVFLLAARLALDARAAQAGDDGRLISPEPFDQHVEQVARRGRAVVTAGGEEEVEYFRRAAEIDIALRELFARSAAVAAPVAALWG